jgi:glycine/D-amino acid oxidase-like deaminating enzyme
LNKNQRIMTSKTPHRLSTEYLIVGGGIVGSSLAYSLAKLDKNVILVEKDFIGSGSTGMSAGTIFCAGYGNRTEPALTSAMETRNTIRELESKGYPCGYHETGSLQIAMTPEENELLKTKATYFKENGYSVDFLETHNDVIKLEPGLSKSVTSALYAPMSGFVDPMATANAFAIAAMDCGATVVENAEVTGLKQTVDGLYEVSFDKAATASLKAAGVESVAQEDGKFVTKTNMQEDGKFVTKTNMQEDGKLVTKTNMQEDGKLVTKTNTRQDDKLVVTAECVVLATGTYPDKLLAGFQKDEQIETVVTKGQVWVSEKMPKNTLNHVIFTTGSHLHWSNNPGKGQFTHDIDGVQHVDHAYGKPMPDGTILFGGDRIPCNGGPDYSENTASLRRNQDYVSSFLPILKNSAQGSWVGMMPFTKTGEIYNCPINHSLYPGLWFLGGFGPHGIMHGPGFAKALAENLTK